MVVSLMRTASALPGALRLSSRNLSGGLIAIAGVAGLVALYLPWSHFEPPAGLGLPPDQNFSIPIHTLAPTPLQAMFAPATGPQWMLIACGLALMFLRGRHPRRIIAVLGCLPAYADSV